MYNFGIFVKLLTELETIDFKYESAKFGIMIKGIKF